MCRLVGNTVESYNPRGAVRTTQSSYLQIRGNLSTNDKWVIPAKSELNKYDGKVPPTCFLEEETTHWTWAFKETDFQVPIVTLAPLPGNLVSDVVDGGTTS
ncbi:hypothetical protein PIB30_055867 [Stylosanthes scabra]|uniref:Uncharacterized protein n=1 Tax=Stylosanthes scabra TaxID=79078 RepID=A0ABU6UIQ2_9FABA|nr:hypothetical protein [Stylosanthes scabra]